MKSEFLALLVIGVTTSVASAQLTITFEELGAQPTGFSSTIALSNQIAGAVFSGPGPLDGGGILDNNSNFGVTPISGANFLAFNRLSFVSYSNGGHATDPEQITFAQPWDDVSIWAAGGFSVDTFTMRAFNAANVQVGMAVVVTQGWAQLQVQAPGIVRIELTQVGDEAWVYDDLSASGSNPVSTYCTAGTTTNGCVPAIAGNGTPSASASSGFTIDVSAVEGQRQGLVFYGIDNTGFTPVAWGTSTSYLCVKSPTQRTPGQNSGGTVNACDGTFTLDWNTYLAGNPIAVGNPFSAGQHVYAQAWFRDPPSPKTTNMSDGLEFVVQP